MSRKHDTPRKIKILKKRLIKQKVISYFSSFLARLIRALASFIFTDMYEQRLQLTIQQKANFLKVSHLLILN